MKSIYLIGSLRNPKIPEIGNYLRGLGFDVFEDWHAAGERADDSWQEYETKRGRSYEEALKGIASRHIFALDFYHLNRCEIGVLALPAGKSGHMELGFMRGQGKPCFVLFDQRPERWDQMYRLMSDITFSVEALGELLLRQEGVPTNGAPLAYLASPYTHDDPQVREARFVAACKKAADLMLAGKTVFSPIAHSHPIADQMPVGMATDGAFWKTQDTPYLEHCDELVVLMLDGWEKSSGIRHEIEVAKQRGIPITYLHP